MVANKHNILRVELNRNYSTDPDLAGHDVIDIALVDMRFARDIRVHYDFERNGYVISAPEGVHEEGYQLDDFAWHEKAFIPAEYLRDGTERGPKTFSE